MNTLRRYLLNDFVTILSLALVVVTFVLSVGYVFKIIDIIARGVPWRPVLTVLVASVPTSLKVSIPMSALVGCLLLFGRLSADCEIVAMKACGVRIRSVSRSILLLTLLLVAAALHVNHYVEPRCHYARRHTMAELGGMTAVSMLENGRFHNFDKFTLYVGNRKDNQLEDIRIFDLQNPEFTREIRAQSGTIEEIPGSLDLLLKMNHVRIDPFSEDSPGPGTVEHFEMVLENFRRHGKYRPDHEDMVLDELIASLLTLRNALPGLTAQELSVARMALLFEINKRTSLALAPLAFVMVGIPLGIRSHRKESSIGIAISLGLVFLFFLLSILAESTATRPHWHPDLIIWIPTVLFLVAGLALSRRMD